MLYDTWQQGEGFKGGGGGEKAAAGSKPGSAQQGGQDGGEKGTRYGGGGERQARDQAALLEREVEEEDRGESLLFSYAVLTTAAAPRLAWLHERWGVRRGKRRTPGSGSSTICCLRLLLPLPFLFSSVCPFAPRFLPTSRPGKIVLSDLVVTSVSTKRNFPRFASPAQPRVCFRSGRWFPEMTPPAPPSTSPPGTSAQLLCWRG